MAIFVVVRNECCSGILLGSQQFPADGVGIETACASRSQQEQPDRVVAHRIAAGGRDPEPGSIRLDERACRRFVRVRRELGAEETALHEGLFVLQQRRVVPGIGPQEHGRLPGGIVERQGACLRGQKNDFFHRPRHEEHRRSPRRDGCQLRGEIRRALLVGQIGDDRSARAAKVVKEELPDPLAVHLASLGKDRGRRHSERLEGKVGHDAPLELVGEGGHEDQVARRRHSRVRGRRRDHRHAVTLREGPHLDCVRRAVGADERDHFVVEDHRFRGGYRRRRVFQAVLDNQLDGTAQQSAARVHLLHRDHSAVRIGPDARDQEADVHRGGRSGRGRRGNRGGGDNGCR